MTIKWVGYQSVNTVVSLHSPPPPQGLFTGENSVP